MKLSKYFYFFSIFLSLLITGHVGVVEASTDNHHRHRDNPQGLHDKKKHEIFGFRPTAMFVFGDSYADTGNSAKLLASCWKQPYGITFPGKPAGRFSDGRVLSDYIAKFLGVKSPIPYRWMKYAKHRLQYGVNFAYGGTGVFDTLALAPNMTTQIDFFQKLINGSVYTKKDVESSLFLVSLAGNDYGSYVAKGGTLEGLPAFVVRVVNKLAANLKRIQGLGGKRIAVTSLPPLGCLPQSTAMSSFRQCNASVNIAVNFHNSLLQKAVANLNKQTKGSSYVILDLFTSFSAALEQKQGSMKFESPMKPCCMGIRNGYSCGSVDEKGVAMYRVCSDPNSAFFWDQFHPTQAGWNAVYTALTSTLQQICK